ncbi:hypothetical protein Tco_0079743 [Tanacetum coccineum]
MLDYKDSTVTYTEVSSAFADLSDIGSPRVDGPPMMPEDPYAYVVAAFQAPPSPDYVPGLEEPDQLPPSPVYVSYVPKPVYPEFMPPEDEVLPAEEQPLPAAALPTINFSCYVPESDPEEDPKEDDEEDPEEDPVDYPADEGDDGDDEDESSNDDKDDDVDVDIEGDEEEEHPTPADFTAIALPTVDHALSAEETEPFETDESTATPPPHLLHTGLYSRISADTPPSGTQPLLPISLPTSSPSLLLPSADHGADMPEVCLPPQKRLCFAFCPRYEDEMLVDMPRAPVTDDIELGRRMIEFATRVRQDTDEIYVRLDDEQTERQPMAGRLNMLYRDRRAHARTALLMEREARMSREAWG